MTTEKMNKVGLSSAEVNRLQQQYGKNELVSQKKQGFLKKALVIICEPMFLLLLVAAIIYFFLGEPRDGAIMLVFVIAMISIDVIQEWKTDKTLNALKDLSAPHVTVIRDGEEQITASSELVPGDIMLLCEGVKIPADGVILKCADLCVDESTLTGEAEAVWKTQTDKVLPNEDYWRRDYCYAGTFVTQGTATVLVEKTGANTEYGKIGTNVVNAPKDSTPLQKQTKGLVKLCSIIAAVLFIMVAAFTFINLADHQFSDRLIESVLSGITLAMAMIPEEFPVILTVFLSMGAWRLAKKKSLVRKLPSVETLGAVSVLCVDKTGTITMNQMTVQETWSLTGDNDKLIETMGLGCEYDVYDPMEKAMLSYCADNGICRDDLFSGELISEYAFTNELKMMGHIWRKDGNIIIAAKGSPEKILTICDINSDDREIVQKQIIEMSENGLRVIAIATASLQDEADVPKKITDCNLSLLGLIGLADPPRDSVKSDIEVCKKAGIRVVMITGDNGVTACSIAKKVGMENCDQVITGDMIDKMSDKQLGETVKSHSVFSRVVPEHKMRIVKAFKQNGEIVAMTGDGVNDAPALKYADIGIAMGKRGSEVSREASDLILMDDNFTTIVETVKDGRRIYDNIRKAVGYVFTIHIPIALASLFAPLMGITPASVLLLPLHVVLLELIIDPTCSIVLERQPAEDDLMQRRPRNPQEKILNSKILIKSIIQGIVMFTASFITYITVLSNNETNAPLARAMGIAVIMLGNLFLVQVNSSNKDFVVKSMFKLIKDKVMWAVNVATIVGLAVILYSPLNAFLKLAPLSPMQLLIVIGVSAISVFWYEVIKAINRLKLKRNK